MRQTRSAFKRRSRIRSRVEKIGIRVGISGWRYPAWRGKFYPKGLPQRRELEFAASRFNSLEINGSFYSLQLPSSYQRWYAETPRDFVFAVKGARFITQMKKLRDVGTPLANFFASGMLALREKLGPILWQLPPNLGYNKERLEDFFNLLPRNTREASKLAKKHDDNLKARAWMKIDPVPARLRYALEVRHKSFMTPEFFDLLRKHNIAFVIADTAGKFPYAEDLTADFVYIRLHGAKKLYVSGYNDKALDWWVKRIEHWCKGRQPGDAKTVTPAKAPAEHLDVFIYFDNDAKVYAPFDAQRLAAHLRTK
jgi:uncharacterized protein YecE (DUF72 family)